MRKFSGFLASLALCSAFYLQLSAISAASLPSPQPLPADIIAAWTNAGARSGWMISPGFWNAISTGQPDCVPAFLFKQWSPGVIAPLPAPDQSFGLDLQDTSITDSGLKELAGFKHLQVLNLAGTHVTDAGLKQLAGSRFASGLQGLTLNNTQVTDSAMNELAGLTRLEFLDLGHTQITDTDLNELSDLTYLQDLNLNDTHVTDVGLKQLAGSRFASGLQGLWLIDTDVTDAGLKELAGMTQLQYLDVIGTHVTEAGVVELKNALPNLQIFH